MIKIKLFDRKRPPVIRQTESAECGLACLAMISSWHGLLTDLPTLRSRFNISTQGMTLQSLIDCASDINFSSRPVRLEPDDLKSLNLPCILHWNMNHFVVLCKVRNNKLTIHDPDKGKLSISVSEAGKYFTGIALELTPNDNFAPRNEKTKIRLRQLTGKTQGLFSSMLRIIIFALALEIITLAGPLINQIVIDEVLVSSDEDLLTIIVISLFLLSITQLLFSLARQLTSINMSVNFNMQWTANVFHHLLRLPLTWFNARSQGSIEARFNAINNIQQALTLQVLGGILDFLLIITSLSMMLLYSPIMTLIALLSALIYGILRIIWHPAIRQATEDAWDAEARESSYFLETLSGILSLRVNGVIAHREAAWLNLNVSRRNTQLQQSRLLMGFDIANTLTKSIASVIILWKGAGEVLDGNFTVGMLVAYLSFNTRFSSSISSLTDSIFSWLLLDVYNERLADIVMTQREDCAVPKSSKLQYDHSPIMNTSIPQIKKMKGDIPIVVENISFKHKGEKTLLINNLSLTLYQKEIVAITGKSGCGKSTLLNIILGIDHPIEGSIQTLGVKNNHNDYLHIRKSIGTVLQNDILFRGSIADNIMFFHEDKNQERMINCAQQALINDDIMAMPMGYQTLIGENGSGLSGGQKQRILLARALYKKPLFLLLDESTSHLDVESEIMISQTLRKIGVPILLIAHRPETLASADRVLLMEQGTLIPVNFP
ncbi:peptidase domain-containing ABC transporter [Citrobacter europaeus]|uniref:peptidase domain-containing ABC transporter n=1 Tax=Citrobacter europaeus TaxID=1914243 RepID=UPI00190218AE|nr:peptidase domain-containing ABC transporter [Citrobacter europaeus]MBJ8822618.1 peptidase domain-containing ABC transporter [Citrobacter freundii]MDT7084495.1 peptidase domain-containing ABC transporter [Citrobacter europaeus]